jgi:hypothetical protein
MNLVAGESGGRARCGYSNHNIPAADRSQRSGRSAAADPGVGAGHRSHLLPKVKSFAVPEAVQIVDALMEEVEKLRCENREASAALN